MTILEVLAIVLVVAVAIAANVYYARQADDAAKWREYVKRGYK
jgi:hypothetical protein